MIKLLAAALFSCGLIAQAPLPPLSNFPIGKISWTFPCGPYNPVTQMTSTQADRVVDPGYPTPNTYACRIGGTFYVRGLQHTASCVTYQPLTTTLPPLFLFGSRQSSSTLTISSPWVMPGQNTIYDGLSVAFAPTHYGPLETDPNVDCWALSVTVPNSQVFLGTEWAAQAAFLTPITGLLHLGTSYYTRIFQ